MERIRVLEVGNKLGGLGGTEQTLRLFVKYMDRSRFEPRVYSWQGLGGDDTGVYEQWGVPFESHDDLPGLLNSFRPHIFHVHRAGWQEPYPIETAKSCGVPIVIETNVFGRHDPSPSGQAIDCHLFVSYFCMRRYQQFLGKPLVSDAYKVVYNPIDVDEFDAFDFSRDMTVPAVGRYSRADNTKWSDICIEMVPYLVQEVPELVYYVIGETQEVRAKIRELGIEAHFRFFPLTGSRTKLFEFLKRFRVLVHGTELGESFGLTIAEAMASRIPAVTHNTHDGRDNAQVELIDHGVNGVVADTPESYAAGVAYLLKNPSAARTMGENGYGKVRTCFEAKKITRGLEEIFEHFYDKKVVRNIS